MLWVWVYGLSFVLRRVVEGDDPGSSCHEQMPALSHMVTEPIHDIFLLLSLKLEPRFVCASATPGLLLVDLLSGGFMGKATLLQAVWRVASELVRSEYGFP